MRLSVIGLQLRIFFFLSLVFVGGRIMIYAANETRPYSYEFIVDLILTGFVAISPVFILWASCLIFKAERPVRLSVWLMGISELCFYLKFVWVTWHSTKYERLIGLAESHVIFLVDSAIVSFVCLIVSVVWHLLGNLPGRSRGDKTSLVEGGCLNQERCISLCSKEAH